MAGMLRVCFVPFVD